MIAVIDYGMGNLRSVQKALQHVSGDAHIVTSPGDVDKAEKIVLPGVGAFGDAIERLRSTGLDQAVRRAIRQNRPMLGICLGFQLLFGVSYEDGQFTGLGIFPGKVIRFEFSAGVTGRRLKIPHMGWNQIRYNVACPLFAGLPAEAYVYFVHSYHPVAIDTNIVAATAEYGYEFPAAVWSGNLFATQFHPEKSQAIGLKMLENFVNL